MQASGLLALSHSLLGGTGSGSWESPASPFLCLYHLAGTGLLMTNLCPRLGAKEEMLLGRKAAPDHPQLLLELPPPRSVLSWIHPNDANLVSICRKFAGIWKGRLDLGSSLAPKVRL